MNAVAFSDVAQGADSSGAIADLQPVYRRWHEPVHVRSAFLTLVDHPRAGIKALLIISLAFGAMWGVPAYYAARSHGWSILHAEIITTFLALLAAMLFAGQVLLARKFQRSIGTWMAGRVNKRTDLSR